MYTDGCRARRVIHLAAAGLFVTLRLAAPVAAQAPGAGSSAADLPRVTVGELAGVAGGSVLVPLSWAPDPQTPVQRLTVEVAYVSNLLVFETALNGAPEEEGDLEVQSTLKAGAPDEKGAIRSTLRVTVSRPAAQAAKALPSGLLAFLIFRISTEAKTSVIPLHASIVAAADMKQVPLQVATVKVRSGSVAVESASMEVAEGTCFFYMH